MNMQNKTVLRTSFFLFGIMVAIGAYVGLWQYHASVTEAALSLCAETLKSGISAGEKTKKVKDLLVFTQIPEDSKQTLLAAIRINDSGLSEIAWQMEYFSYSVGALRELCTKIDRLSQDSVTVFRVAKPETAEENAEELIRKLFGRRVPFQTEEGTGTNFSKRYYCANICVDACLDGSIRYLADVKAVGGEDPLIALVFSDASTEVIKTEEICGMIFQRVRSKAARAELCIYAQTGRVFAAKILFNS